MQLELAFVEQSARSSAPPKTPWQEIDPEARIAALGILSRLIAQMLTAGPARDAGDD